MRYRGPRNRGGWPAKKKFIFDTAAHRRTIRALDTLIAAQEYVISKRDRDYDPVDICHDPITRDAWELLETAKRRVQNANDDAQKEAKLRDEASSVADSEGGQTWKA